MEEPKKRKSRSKSNGEGSIYSTTVKGKPYYTASLTIGVDDDGKLIRKSFCSFKKQDVIKRMAEYKSQLDQGLTSSNDKITLKQWVHTWLFEFKINELKDTSFERYEGIYRNYIKNSSLGRLKLIEVRATHIQSYYNTLAEQGKTTSIIKTLNKILQSSLTAAIKQGYITRNYCSLITIPKCENDSSKDNEIVFFTPEEQKIFIDSLGKNKNRMLFILALGSGLRLGELLALKWDNIDLINNTLSVTRAISRLSKVGKDGSRTWSVLEHSPKTKSSIRTIPLPTNIIKELKTHKKEQDKDILKYGELYQKNNLVFCTDFGGYLDTRNLTRSYERALVRAEIEHKKFHSMRHTYATRLFEHNVPVKTVQMLMGHSDIATTMNIYTHVTPEQMTDEVQKLNTIFNF